MPEGSRNFLKCACKSVKRSHASGCDVKIYDSWEGQALRKFISRHGRFMQGCQDSQVTMSKRYEAEQGYATLVTRRKGRRSRDHTKDADRVEEVQNQP